MENRRNEERREPEIVYSHAVKAGKRIYYLDVKKARNEDLYLCITESKRKQNEFEGAPVQLEKHRLFLYKEDFAHFAEGLKDVMSFVERQVGEIEERPLFEHREEESEDEARAAEQAPQVEETPEEEPERTDEKRGFFSRLMSK